MYWNFTLYALFCVFSLKKLHEIQLYAGGLSVFYLPNLERNLSQSMNSLIGTESFSSNQFDLNFMWQQMENTEFQQQQDEHQDQHHSWEQEHEQDHSHSYGQDRDQEQAYDHNKDMQQTRHTERVVAQMQIESEMNDMIGFVEDSYNKSSPFDDSGNHLKYMNCTGANTAYRNFQYFTRQSRVDYRSSIQLIYDVLMQMLEVTEHYF